MALQAEKERTGGRKQLIAFRVPGFDAGFIARERNGVRGAGDAFVQARVRRGGQEGRFDDLAGRGFMIVARGGDPRAALSQDDLNYWTSIGGRIARIGGEDDGPDVVIDVAGQYCGLMDEYGCDVIVKRPDFHIFGACPTLRELPALLADLSEQLRTGMRQR